MPVEIRELVIEASIRTDTNQEDGPDNLATEKDLKELTENILERIRSEGSLRASERIELMEDMKREVKQMLEDQWRK